MRVSVLAKFSKYFSVLAFVFLMLFSLNIGKAQSSRLSSTNIEGKTYETAIYSQNALYGLATTQGFYIFEADGKVIYRIIGIVPGGTRTEMRYDILTQTYQPTTEFVPPIVNSKDEIGTYNQNGNKIRIVFANRIIEGTIKADNFEGVISYSQANQKEPILLAKSLPVNSAKGVDVSQLRNFSSNNKHSAPVDSPIIGTWKYQDGCTTTEFAGAKATSCNRTSIYDYSQDGVVKSTHIINLSLQTIAGNWKYTAENESSGVLEEFKDGKLVEKGNVKFLGKSQLQYTITFSGSSDIVGKIYIWNKQ